MSYYLPPPSDPDGPYLPPGGLLNQYLRKNSDLDYDVEWANVSGSLLVELDDVDADNRVDGSLVVYDADVARFTVDNNNTVTSLTDGGVF